MPFQADGIRLIEKFKGRAYLGDEMGLGKTVQALVWANEHEDAYPLVVICPAYLKSNWEAEAKKWSKGRRVAVLEGRKVSHPVKADIYILGYECTLPLKIQRRRKKIVNRNTWTEWLRCKGVQTIVADEAHYIKNKGAIRSKGVRQLCKGIRHVLLLSGTPIENRPAELWFPLSVLVPGLFPSWFDYGTRYCGPRCTGFGWEFNGATHLKELWSILKAKVMIRRLKKDVLKDLPKKRRTPLLITLTTSELKEYRQAENNFAEWLYANKKSPEALKAQALVRAGVLKQLSAKAKIPAMVHWVQDALEEEDKVAVYCIHRSVASALASELKMYNPVVATGAINKKIRRLAVQRFQEEKKVRLFIGTFAAAGTGVTLTKASHILCAELPWSGAILSQGEDRLHRIGQTRPVWSWLAIAKGTIDEDNLAMIDRKNRVVSGSLDGVKIKKEESLWELMLKRRNN